MLAPDFEDREIIIAFAREVREESPPPAALRAVAAEVVARFEKRRALGVCEEVDRAWERCVTARLADSIYQDLRKLERAPAYNTRASDEAQAPPVTLGATQGLRNPTTGVYERVETRRINREQFRRWHARQMHLFATEQEKARWGERVSRAWERHPELPDLEAVCAASGIPFEATYAAEMG